MKLNLYDKELNRIAFLDENFISCLWKENYNSTGTLTLELPATEELKTLVKPDCYVGRWDRDTLMVIKSVTLADNKLTCNGFTADRQLDDVAYIGTINDGTIVVNAIKNAYSKTEGYPLFSIADSDITDKYPSQISHKSILTLLKTMCGAADIGYKAVKVDKAIQIQFYKPGENDNLKFSKDYGNLQDFSLFHSTAALKNYAIVMGAGEGDNRAKAEVDIRTDKTEQKRAVIIDAKDIQYEDGDTDASYKQKLIARGLEKLLDYQPVKEVDFSPIYTLGADYDLGDILTALLNDYGLKIKSRITSYMQKQQNNSIQTTVELGDKQTRTTTTTTTSGKANINNMLSIYPVGSIYMSINDTNPHDLFGGTWEQIKGRFLVGVGPLDDNTTDYWGALTGKYNMPAGEKGGQTKHKLTIDEMPYHNHDVSILANGWEGWGDDSYSDHEYSFTSWSNPKVFGGNTEHTNHVQTGVTSRYGGDGEHNNIPPYYAVYMWKRTA